jgi:hypothetical protein
VTHLVLAVMLCGGRGEADGSGVGVNEQICWRDDDATSLGGRHSMCLLTAGCVMPMLMCVCVSYACGVVCAGSQRDCWCPVQEAAA